MHINTCVPNRSFPFLRMNYCSAVCTSPNGTARNNSLVPGRSLAMHEMSAQESIGGGRTVQSTWGCYLPTCQTTWRLIEKARRRRLVIGRPLMDSGDKERFMRDLTVKSLWLRHGHPIKHWMLCNAFQLQRRTNLSFTSSTSSLKPS